MQAIQDPTGRENIKNIYFGIIMGVSAALPTFHFFLFFSSVFKSGRKISFSQKKKILSKPIDRLPKAIIFRNDGVMNRRSFIKQVCGTSVCLPALRAHQPFPTWEILACNSTLCEKRLQRMPKTLEEVAKVGYRQVEPYGFPSPQSIEMIKRARDLGMKVNSSHFIGILF